MKPQAPYCLLFVALFSVGYLTSCDSPSPSHPPDPRTFYSDPQAISLIQAVEREDLREIDRLVAAGADVNRVGVAESAEGSEGVTPLLWAFLQRKKSAFRRLLELGADSNDVIRGHGTVIENAAGDPDPEWLRLSLEHHGNPDAVGTLGETPIFSVITAHRVDNIRLLADAGANLDFRTEHGGAPLIDAAQQFWFDLVHYLLERGADYTRRSPSGRNIDLAYWIIYRPVNRESDQWTWREKVIDFLEAKGFDFGPAYELVAEKHPDAAELWREDMDAALRRRRIAARSWSSLSLSRPR